MRHIQNRIHHSDHLGPERAVTERGITTMAYIAEYIWIDGTEPTAKLRSKAQVIADDKEPGIWGFDGSSTNQATGDQSDVVLNPVRVTPDPIRGGSN